MGARRKFYDSCKQVTLQQEKGADQKTKISTIFKLAYHISVHADSDPTIMKVHRLHWLDYDVVSFPLLVIAMGMLELLVLGF